MHIDMYFKIPNLIRVALLSGLTATCAYVVLPHLGITHGLLHAELIAIPAGTAAGVNTLAQARHRGGGRHRRDQDRTGSAHG